MTTPLRRARLFCPHCASETDCEIVCRPAEIHFRGKGYAVEEEFARCGACGQEFDVLGLRDPLTEVYARYRQEQGLPSASEVRAVRERLLLTEEEFGRLIGGATKSTVRFYERGALPSDEHAEALKGLVARYLPPIGIAATCFAERATPARPPMDFTDLPPFTTPPPQRAEGSAADLFLAA